MEVLWDGLVDERGFYAGSTTQSLRRSAMLGAITFCSLPGEHRSTSQEGRASHIYMAVERTFFWQSAGHRATTVFPFGRDLFRLRWRDGVHRLAARVGLGPTGITRISVASLKEI